MKSCYFPSEKVENLLESLLKQDNYDSRIRPDYYGEFSYFFQQAHTIFFLQLVFLSCISPDVMSEHISPKVSINEKLLSECRHTFTLVDKMIAIHAPIISESIVWYIFYLGGPVVVTVGFFLMSINAIDVVDMVGITNKIILLEVQYGNSHSTAQCASFKCSLFHNALRYLQTAVLWNN